MTAFEPERAYRLCIRRTPPAGKKNPTVVVKAAPFGQPAKDVVGKVDTGADRTLLTADTAAELGLVESGATPLKRLKTASGDELSYWNSWVQFDLGAPNGEPFTFAVHVAVSPAAQRNLFGLDWLDHMCLGADAESVCFMRD